MNSRAGSTQETFEVTIEKLVYGGSGLGRHKGKVVFVPYSVAGDLLLVRALESKKNLIHAELVEVLQPGRGRQQPRCPYFGQCGGCQLQQLVYAFQIENKRRILEELFEHKFPYTQDLLISMKASPRDFAYRSRARLQARGYGALARVGFYKHRWHEVEDIQECPLLIPPLNDALREIRVARIQAASDPGPMEVEIIGSDISNEWLAEAFAAQETNQGTGAFPRAAGENLGASLRHKVAGFTYLVSPGVFFQTNLYILPDLVSIVGRLAAGSHLRTALDLYSGAGLFSLPLAPRFKQVVAIESSEFAYRLCLKNAAAAGLTNIRAKCADVAAWMRAVGSVSPPQFDLVVLDPPRMGAGKQVMDCLREWAPETIIYVSCDPQTLCRDLAQLPPDDYSIDFIEGYDMFPQTYHFETVVRLKRR